MEKYLWTQHSLYKMKQYGLSEQRLKRVIRAPFRTEEGIVKNTIAVMQPAGNASRILAGRPSPNQKATLRLKQGEKPAWKQEIWVMYQTRKARTSKDQIPNSKQIESSRNWKIKVISAWRYPGVSPKNSPIPEEIVREVKRMIA